MEHEVILDTVVIQSLWTGGEGIQWLTRVVDGELSAAVSAASVAELVRQVPDRRAEIQLTALLSVVGSLALTTSIARKAGQIARELDSEDSSALVSAMVAATALDSSLPVACVDEEFFAAMGCAIASAKQQAGGL